MQEMIPSAALAVSTARREDIYDRRGGSPKHRSQIGTGGFPEAQPVPGDELL